MNPPPDPHETTSKPRVTRSLISGLSGSTRARRCAHLAPTVNNSAVRGHSSQRSQLPAPTSLSQSDIPRARDTHADCITDWPCKGLGPGALKTLDTHAVVPHPLLSRLATITQTAQTQCKHAFAISSCQHQHTPFRRTKTLKPEP